MRSDALAQFRLSRNMMSSFLAGLFLRCTLRRKTDAGMADQLIKDHEHGRQHEDHRKHTDNRASCHQVTQGADHINIRIKSDAKGCGEKAQRTDND